MAGTELIKRATVEEIVGHRNRAIEQYDIMAAAAEAMDTAWRRACSPSGTPQGLAGAGRDFRPSTDRERFVRELDGQCWRAMATLTRINELMDVKEREKFHDQLRTSPIPVTVDNVVATLATLMGSAGDIFNRSVIATFEALPRSYKSNDGFKFGRRIIFAYALAQYGGWNHYSDAEGRIRDLDRIWHMVDGKALPDNEDPQGAVKAVSAAIYTGRSKAFEIESRHFHLKGHLNGALHVWPKDRDLTARVNLILARHYGWALGDGRKNKKAA